MKNIFSFATFIALSSFLVFAAPLTPRNTQTVGPTFFQIIKQAQPDINFQTTLIPQISVQNGNNEVDSFVSFDIPAFAGVTSSSTCHFVLTGVSATPGSAIQLFSLGSPLIGNESFNKHPYYDQDEGQYAIDHNTGNSSPLYGGQVPCNFGGKMQFVIRPHFTDSSITWTQSSSVGAFIVVNL